MIRRIAKRAALAIPSIRRVHEEREALQQRVQALQQEKEGLLSEVESLRDRSVADVLTRWMEDPSWAVTPGLRVGLVGTIPRSGTWYHIYFFSIYDKLCQGMSEHVIRELVEREPHTHRFFYYGRSVGTGVFYLMHFFCPGFRKYDGRLRPQWERLSDWGEHVGYDGAREIVRGNEEFFDPRENPTVRIVHVYRNPLDQAVSFFRHSRHHVDEETRRFTDSNGRKVVFSSPSHFLFTVGLEAYLKQHLTYVLMKRLYPDNIVMLPYENALRDPVSHFRTILAYFGHNPRKLENGDRIRKALQLSSRRYLKDVEKKLGHVLGDDQTSRLSSHIRDGSIGQWRQYFTEKDLEIIDDRLHAFELSLADFDLGEVCCRA